MSLFSSNFFARKFLSFFFHFFPQTLHQPDSPKTFLKGKADLPVTFTIETSPVTQCPTAAIDLSPPPFLFTFTQRRWRKNEELTTKMALPNNKLKEA
jgi:hypothetical protein